jgi:hypothetical protein
LLGWCLPELMIARWMYNLENLAPNLRGRSVMIGETFNIMDLYDNNIVNGRSCIAL